MAHDYDVGIIGAGSGAETLVRQLDESGLTVVVFEPALVGGECPYFACMPSKSLLHDARTGAHWAEAVQRRNELVDHLDDSQHTDELVRDGVELVRERARIGGANVVVAGDRRYHVEHLVLATGASAVMAPIEGADECAARIWTSADALTSDELPASMVVVGAGVIGMECGSLFSRFGCDVTLIDSAERSFADAPVEVSDILAESLRNGGVDVRYDVEADSIRMDGDSGVIVTLSDSTEVAAERVLVAIGRRPATNDLGLETLGIDPDAELPLEPSGRLRVDGSVWAIGDVAGQGQYTHLANHQARVVADHLVGTATRRFDDVVTPRCMFTDPPLIEIGPSWSELREDPDIVEAEQSLDSFPRSATDQLVSGHLWIAARRSTGCIVAATGVGPSFDELSHTIVTAVDGAIPVARLRQSMQAFPTIGEILGPLYNDLHDQLTGS